MMDSTKATDGMSFTHKVERSWWMSAEESEHGAILDASPCTCKGIPVGTQVLSKFSNTVTADEK